MSCQCSMLQHVSYHLNISYTYVELVNVYCLIYLRCGPVTIIIQKWERPHEIVVVAETILKVSYFNIYKYIHAATICRSQCNVRFILIWFLNVYQIEFWVLSFCFVPSSEFNEKKNNLQISCGIDSAYYLYSHDQMPNECICYLFAVMYAIRQFLTIQFNENHRHYFINTYFQ